MSNRLLHHSPSSSSSPSPLARHPTADPVFVARQKKKESDYISAQLVGLGLLNPKHGPSRRHHTSRVDEVATDTSAAEEYPKKSRSPVSLYLPNTDLTLRAIAIPFRIGQRGIVVQIHRARCVNVKKRR